MREYLGRSGNLVYLGNLDFDECRVFNRFGKLERRASGVIGYAESRSRVEVDLLSIIGDTMMNMSEVYLDGRKATVGLSFSGVIARLGGKLELEDSNVYRIVHEDGFIQVVLPLKKGKQGIVEIEKAMGTTLNWEKLS